jgi:propanol-preferring alcohol dehydrogenase
MAMATMIAMVLDAPGQPLRRVERPIPQPKAGEVLVQVVACGICRTDLHIIDGEVPARFPIVPGHEIVGRVIALGPGPSGTLACGDWVGIAWLGHSCGTCPYCRSGRENVCDQPGSTGATRDGGFAAHVIAEAAYCLPLPPALAMAEAAPLLCAGLIGWRALRRAGQADPIGIYGFGAAGHLVAPLAIGQGRRVLAFTRPGDTARQALARELGCAWAGSSETASPVALDAALIFASDGALVPKALQAVRKGGRVICAGIHMSDIPNFPYADLWGEREICSIANLTREDGLSFLPMAVASGLTSRVTHFPLGDANRAIQAVRDGRIDGAALLRP